VFAPLARRATRKTQRALTNVHWQAPAYGQALVVTYMLVRDDVESSGARNCRKMTSLDHLIAASKLAPSAVTKK
jgi:hypothetical protein